MEAKLEARAKESFAETKALRIVALRPEIFRLYTLFSVARAAQENARQILEALKPMVPARFQNSICDQAPG
jgi:hypothetical protein